MVESQYVSVCCGTEACLGRGGKDDGYCCFVGHHTEDGNDVVYNGASVVLCSEDRHGQCHQTCLVEMGNTTVWNGSYTRYHVEPKSESSKLCHQTQ